MFRGNIIDLSQEIYTGMPLYPGQMKTVIWTHLSRDECARQLGTGSSYETRGIQEVCPGQHPYATHGRAKRGLIRCSVPGM